MLRVMAFGQRRRTPGHERLIQHHPGENRADRQHNQRRQHHGRRFMNVIHGLLVRARRTVERHEQQTPRIKRRHERGGNPHPVSEGPKPCVIRIRGLQHDVLGIIPGEGWNPRQRQRPDPHQDIGKRDQLADTAHIAHILLVRHRVNDRTRAEEQQRLEKRMRNQVKHRRAIGRHAQSEKHISKLTHRRIRDHALDVELRQADGRRHKRRTRANHRHHHQRIRRIFKYR